MSGRIRPARGGARGYKGEEAALNFARLTATREQAAECSQHGSWPGPSGVGYRRDV